MRSNICASPKGIRIELSFFFVAALTLLFIFDSGYNAFLSILAILLHEGAHIAALFLLGGRIKKIRMTLCEFNISADTTGFSRRKEFLTAVSGPLANILFGIAIFPFAEDFGKINLILGFFQLLPVTSLDGDNILSVLSVGGNVRKLLSLALAFSTALLGFVILLHTRYNFSVLAMSLYLIFITLTDRLQ